MYYSCYFVEWLCNLDLMNKKKKWKRGIGEDCFVLVGLKGRAMQTFSKQQGRQKYCYLLLDQETENYEAFNKTS